MKRFIACLLTSAILPSVACAAIPLITSYVDLVNALKKGHRVNAVADNSKCNVIETDEGATIKGSVSPDLTLLLGLSFDSNFFMTYRDRNDPRDYIFTIATNTIGEREEGLRLRYKRISVYDDNTAEVYASRGDYKTGKEIGRVRSICGINTGDDKNGLSLYDYDA